MDEHDLELMEEFRLELTNVCDGWHLEQTIADKQPIVETEVIRHAEDANEKQSLEAFAQFLESVAGRLWHDTPKRHWISIDVVSLNELKKQAPK